MTLLIIAHSCKEMETCRLLAVAGDHVTYMGRESNIYVGNTCSIRSAEHGVNSPGFPSTLTSRVRPSNGSTSGIITGVLRTMFKAKWLVTVPGSNFDLQR